MNVLHAHHSASTLPEAATRRLAKAMSSSNDNWCYYCNQYAKKRAKFCGICGGENGKKPPTQYLQQDTPAPWQSQSWQVMRPPSPRDRRRPSPRGRNKGGGKDGKDRQQEGKGKNRPPPPAAPTPKALPVPPKPPRLAAPTTAVSADVAPDAQSKLDALVAALRTADSLPTQVMAILGEQTDASTRDHAKAMHRAVSQTTHAEQELNRIRSSRKAYLSSWEQYIGQLCQTVETQFASQKETLDNFDQLEQKWTEKLAESSTALSRLTGDKRKPEQGSDSELDSRMDATAEDFKDPWVCDQFITQQRQQQAQLVQALRQARDTAAQTAAAAARGASRTPRRGRCNDDDQDDKAQDSKKAKDGEHVADPGKAPT